MRFLALATFLATLVAMLSMATAARSQPGSPQVVVNDANPSSSITSREVERLFLKKTTKWTDGTRVKVVDQSESSTVRQHFSQEILGRSVSKIRAYWQKMIFSGRETPPTQLGSDDEVLDFVRSQPGAIGYVSPGKALGRGVRALPITQ